MFKWTEVEIWTKRTLARNHYRFRHWLMDDLLQEARIVHWRTTERYTDDVVVRHAAKSGRVENRERSIARSRMAYYQRALMNRLNSIAALVETRVAQSTHSVDDLPQRNAVSLRGAAGCDLRSWELSHDLQRAPLVCTVLQRASWDDGRRPSRTPRRRKDGAVETMNQVLCRLGKLQPSQDVAAELAELIGVSF